MDPARLYVALASIGLAGVLILAAAGLRAWNGWLALKREQQCGSRIGRHDAGAGPPGVLADLRERVARLEAIASGSDRGR